MPCSWKGTFEIWENEAFAEIFARHTGRTMIVHPDMKDTAIFLSRRPLLGNTTLYAYNLREVEMFSRMVALAEEMRVARMWIYSVDDLPGLESFRECSYTTTIDLARSEDELWSAISAQARRKVRRDMKDGVKIKIAESEDELLNWWRIYTSLSSVRNFRPQPWRLVHALFKEPALSRLFVAIGDARVIGGFFFLVNTYPMYWLGAFDRADKRYRSAYLNMWHAILFFRAKGFRILDLGGMRMDDSYGPDQFKRSFAGETQRAFTYQVPIVRGKLVLLELASYLAGMARGLGNFGL